MSTTARKLRKRTHRAATASLAAVLAIHGDSPQARRRPVVRAARGRAESTAYHREPKVGTPVLDRASFYDQSERRQLRQLDALGKLPKSARALSALTGKLAARRPERPQPTRIRGRR